MAEKTFVKYTHHGAEVSVREDLKGTHRDVCLCYDCTKFKLSGPDGVSKCPIASRIFDTCVACQVVTPVFECPEFVQGERYHFTTPTGQ